MNQTDTLPKPSTQPSSAIGESEHRFPLMVGEYEGCDAGELALNMMSSNLEYHKLLLLREFEGIRRTSRGIDDKKKRLEQYKSDAFQLLRAARDEGKCIKVDVEIKLTVA